MEYPTQITVDKKLVELRRNWTTDERQRYERILCAFIASGEISHLNVKEAHCLAFGQMLKLDDFYTQTQTTENE